MIDVAILRDDPDTLVAALERRGVELRGELRDVAVAAYVVDPAQQVRRPDVLACLRARAEKHEATVADRRGFHPRVRTVANHDAAIQEDEIGVGLRDGPWCKQPRQRYPDRESSLNHW